MDINAIIGEPRTEYFCGSIEEARTRVNADSDPIPGLQHNDSLALHQRRFAGADIFLLLGQRMRPSRRDSSGLRHLRSFYSKLSRAYSLAASGGPGSRVDLGRCGPRRSLPNVLTASLSLLRRPVQPSHSPFGVQGPDARRRFASREWSSRE